MKVKEMIVKLADMDPEAEVHVAYPAGDYWRTTVAPAASKVWEGTVKHSGYHGKDVLVPEEDLDEADRVDEEGNSDVSGVHRVVVIR